MHDTHIRFRLQLVRLGLSRSKGAQLLKVGESTVKRWINGDEPMPDWPLAKLEALEDAIQAIVDRVTATLPDLPDREAISLPVYRTQQDYEQFARSGLLPVLPFNALHDTMTSWLVDAIEDSGYPVILRYVAGDESIEAQFIDTLG